jgi:hypothetical protein
MKDLAKDKKIYDEKNISELCLQLSNGVHSRQEIANKWAKFCSGKYGQLRYDKSRLQQYLV